MTAGEDREDSSLVPTSFDKEKLVCLESGDSHEGEAGNWKVIRYKDSYMVLAFKNQISYEYKSLVNLLKDLNLNKLNIKNKITAEEAKEEIIKPINPGKTKSGGVTVYNTGLKVIAYAESKKCKIFTPKTLNETEIKKHLQYMCDEMFLERDTPIQVEQVIV